MAVTKIDGSRQIKDASITNAQQNFGTPSASTDVAIKSYVDSVAQGLDVKASVRVATTAAGTLATSFANGQTVDGKTLVTGDRILIKNQATGSENGIYIVAVSGAPTRATDADTSAKVTSGMFTFVEEGTTNAGTGWVLTTANPITLNTTSLTFSQFSGGSSYTNGNGLNLTGNTFSVKLDGASLSVGASGLRITAGTGGQVLVNDSTNTPISMTLSGDVASVSNTGSVTLASGVMKSTNYIVRETPTGTINGSNTSFTLANTPVSGTEQIYLNGILQDAGAGNDYTISGATITMLSAPLTGDKLRVTYLK